MKIAYRNYFILLFFIFCVFNCFSQSDSLIYYYSHPSIATHVAGEHLLEKYTAKDSIAIRNIASKLSKKEDKVAFYHSVSDRFDDLDDYETSRIYASKALRYARLTLDKELIANQLELVGDIYRLQDKNTEALKLLLQSMYMYRELGATKDLSHSLGLIGDLYRCIDQPQEALKYLNESLEIAVKNNYIKDIAFCYSSLGATYQAMGDYDRSFTAFNKGLKLAQKTNNEMRIIDFNYSIGDLMVDRNRIPEAIVFLDEAVRLCKISNDQYNLGFCRMGLARAYFKKKDYDRALEEGLDAYRIGIELNAFGFCSEVSEVLYKAYAAKNDYKNAYKYLKVLKDNADSTSSNEIIKQQAQIEINFRNSFQEKQDSLVRFTHEKQKDLVHQSELKQQKIFTIAGILGLLIALVVTIIVFRSYKKEKHSRKIINKQKAIVDIKNKEILDSINYARKIQQAIIPTDAEVKNIFPESFIILLPKDIVSGDFYWITEKENFIFLAVADCTGHGVPGGFMSMLGTALLNEIINDKNIYEPADILDMLKLKIILALRQSDNINENKDGMDIALICINKLNNKLKFSGANNSVYLIRDNKLTEFKGDKHPIGFSFNNTKRQFIQVEVDLEKGDSLYMFTDGYPDQFGGPLGKKFKYKPLEQMLLQIQNEEMKVQEKKLLNLHDQWKGSLEQVDDICVVGLKI